MMKVGKKLFVFMNGLKVGWLEKQKTGLHFKYDADWLDHPMARPLSLSLPLSEGSFKSEKVYFFFDNLLPDNPNVRKRIQTMFHVGNDHAFDLLAAIGRDCIGAIQLLPEDEINVSTASDCVRMTDKKIAQILKNYQYTPLGMQSENIDFRISLAGAQEKSAFLYQNKKWYQPKGMMPTSHIFKLPIGKLPYQDIDLSDSCENEWLCAQIVEAFGIPIASTKIKEFDDTKVLVVERFDRKQTTNGRWLRFPQEDMCQALGYPSTLKYQADGGPGIKDILTLLLGSENALNDRKLFFKSQIIFYLLAAIDGHAKNFSIFLKPHGGYHLTPLYDVISVYPLIAKKQLHPKKIKMAMALLGKNNQYHWINFHHRHFLSTAKQARYSVNEATQLIDEVLATTENVIDNVQSVIPNDFPTEISEPIFEGILKAAKKLKA